MIIFGGTGDLSFRKLLPALYMAHLHCNLPPETRILTIGRKPWSREEYIAEFMEQKAKPFIEKKAFDAAAWDKFLALFEYVRMDVDSADAAINAPGTLTVQNPHLALTNHAFESTQVAKMGNAPLADEDRHGLLEWRNDPDRKIHDRSIRLLLGLR